MAIMVTLFLGAVSLAVTLACWLVADHRAWQRCYDYAVEQAESRDVLDPKGQAYSDMATVLVLGRPITMARHARPVAPRSQGQ